MQVPEKLTLIGGSILLASTLVFTLKSQASNILPKVDSGMSVVFHDDSNQSNSSSSHQQGQQPSQQDQQKQQQAQADQTFNNNFQQAQQKGWQTGQWGSAKFYVDDQSTMHVGKGQISGSFAKVVNAQQIKTISLDEDVQAPQDSSYLFSSGSSRSNKTLKKINDLSHLSTSHATNMTAMFSDSMSLSSLDFSHFDTHNVTNMGDMFEEDDSLNNLDLSHFNTSNVTDMGEMFYNDISLTNLDVSHFDTSKVTDITAMFYDDRLLSNLDLSHFDTSNVSDMNVMFDSTNIHQLSLGSNTKIQNNLNNGYKYESDLDGTYQNNGQTLNLDGNAHPGTWVKQ